MFGCVRHEGGGRSQHKQRVQLQLMELEGVTLSNGVLFAKVRLLGGGRFCQYSARKEIRDNKVAWSDQGPMEFACRPGGPGPCALRVSVRKEERGGRSYSKLGYAVLDLSALTQDSTEHSCILSPYSQHQRLDNSTLRLSLKQIAGQPAMPALSPASASGEAPAVASAGATEAGASETAATTAVDQEAAVGHPTDGFEPQGAAAAAAAAAAHRRNPSTFSFGSVRTHSRNNSLEQDSLFPANCSQSSSVPSFDVLPTTLERKRAALTPTRELSSRIANTRTDNFKMVREVLEQEGIRIVLPESNAS